MSTNEDDGVWSRDIEEAFEEALAIYPPCGRRKIILSDEGKMFGRNELIARYIKMRTGKSRSRKQVSSHIQVLARKRQREYSGKPRDGGPSFAGMSSAEIVSLSAERHSSAERASTPTNSKNDKRAWSDASAAASDESESPSPSPSKSSNSNMRVLLDRFVAYVQNPDGSTHRIVNLNNSLGFVDLSMEHIDLLQLYDKFPGLRDTYQSNPKANFFLIKFWADLAYDFPALSQEKSTHFITARYESLERLTIEVSSQVIALGRPIVEKIQVEYATEDSGRYVYNFAHVPMCPYLMSFVQKLKSVDTIDQMNRVLENFTVVQVARDAQTKEVLFCTAYVFEVSPPGCGSRNHIYRLSDTQLDVALGRRYTA